AALFASGGVRRIPRGQAPDPRAGAEARLGSGARCVATHEAVLRPLRSRDLVGGLPALRRRRPRARPRPRRRLPPVTPPATKSIGSLAIVLHSHMPYVEGFGTYPFGEEWLFDAVARCYLPLLDRVRDLTVTVTPVLADQLEASAVAERMTSVLRRYRPEAAGRDAAQSSPELRLAAEGEAER